MTCFGITRRSFLALLGGMFWPGREKVVLEAIAAEQMPHRIIAHNVGPANFFELREYDSALGLSGIFHRHGMTLHSLERSQFLFGFDSLAEREQAWRSVNADPEWIAARGQVNIRKIALYHRAS